MDLSELPQGEGLRLASNRACLRGPAWQRTDRVRSSRRFLHSRTRNVGAGSHVRFGSKSKMVSRRRHAVFPAKQTLISASSTSASCHQQTFVRVRRLPLLFSIHSDVTSELAEERVDFPLDIVDLRQCSEPCSSKHEFWIEPLHSPKSWQSRQPVKC